MKFVFNSNDVMASFYELKKNGVCVFALLCMFEFLQADNLNVNVNNVNNNALFQNHMIRPLSKQTDEKKEVICNYLFVNDLFIFYL